MISQISAPRLKGHRFPRSIISYAVWAYYRFSLSLRDVEDLLAERVDAMTETERLAFADRLETSMRRGPHDGRPGEGKGP